jgi:hypothetical protein
MGDLGLCVKNKEDIVAARVWHENQFTMDGHLPEGTFKWRCFI